MTKIDFIGFNFYYDAGHGWLETSIDLLQHLKIEDKISSCSYIDKKTDKVYLEEDCDAAILINTLKDKGIEYSINQVDAGNYAFIRGLRTYS